MWVFLFLFSEEDIKVNEERANLQNRLDDTGQMLSRLKQIQHERLSGPPPPHLSNVPKASNAEMVLAEKVTENLSKIAKKLPPSAIAPVDGLRRAMGIAPLGGPEPMEVEPITHNPTIVADNTILQSNNRIPSNLLPTADILATNNATNQSLNMVNANSTQIPMQIDISHNSTTPLLGTTETSGVPDLESELREFLESDPTLGHSPLHDDKTLEDILSES